MKILHFKEWYEIKLRPEPSLFIDPIARILEGIKTTTLRLKAKTPGDYRIRQGNYMKPRYDSSSFGWHLHIYLLEKITIESLSKEQIRKDIGLTNGEMKVVSAYYPDVNIFFLKAMRKINRKHLILATDTLYLCYFKVALEPNEVVATLDDFVEIVHKGSIYNVAKPEFHESKGDEEDGV